MSKVFITTSTQKNELLKMKNPKEQLKIFTLEEVKQIYPFLWNEKTLDYIISNYHVIYDIAKIYLEQIILYPIEKINDTKGLFLKNLKKDLQEQKLLKENILFMNYLKKQEIITNLPKTKELETYFKDLIIIYLKENEGSYKPEIFELTDIELEIAFVGEKIAELFRQGVSPEKIYISNLNESYHFSLIRIFSLLNIPFQLKTTKTISETKIGNTFLKNYQTEEEIALESIKALINSPEEQEIYNQIIEIINKYIDLKNKKEFIIHDLSTTKIKEKKHKNKVTEIDWKEKNFNTDEYLFLLNCNINELPKNKKNEDYLDDKIKKIINIETSNEKNKQEKIILIKKIKTIPHCIMTYKKRIGSKEFYPSPLIEELGETKTKNTLQFNVSNEFNELYLASELDEYTKYNTISQELLKLENHYQIPYRTYNNNFTGINKEKIIEKLMFQLNLSYTSLDTYLKCPFRYYLTYILKIIPYQETFSLYIGNLFHKILTLAFDENTNWEEIYLEEINKKQFSNKEKYFLKKLQKDLDFIIQTIKTQHTYMDYSFIEKEKEIIIEKNDSIKLSFTGKIDKLIIKEEQDKSIVTIIDYKTGTSFNKEEYYSLGFHLQLPIYSYLVRKSINRKIVVGGIYYQNIVPTRINYDEKYTYDYLLKKSLKLNGYSHKNQNILKYIDSSFKDSHIINGLKIKNDGDFYQTAKVLEESDFETLDSIIEKHLEQSAKNILNADFPIQSKFVDNKDNISCNYCPLKDICYHTPKENIYLQSKKIFSKKEEE